MKEFCILTGHPIIILGDKVKPQFCMNCCSRHRMIQEVFQIIFRDSDYESRDVHIEVRTGLEPNPT